MVSALPIVWLLFAAAAAGTLPQPTGDASKAAPTSCASGVQIFVARGSTERSSLGRIAPVAQSIANSIPGSSITALDYPAKMNPIVYLFSVSKGTKNLSKLVKNYVEMCPQSKIVLIGYSQGAHVVGDLVCGASSLPIVRSKPINSNYNKNIIATLLFGDPTRAANQSFDVGTVTNRNGFLRRHRNGACSAYTKTIKSWCDKNDRWCDKHSPEGTDSSVHKTYQEKYKAEATQFVLDQWKSSQETLAT
ncbi:hypothetical protein PpBr36_00048 [Pyricularia pennisetigena]|uniref:hypothetical protein n=1 Tax=Pyricularia pennisetigena TaxID=1578925 RepID=UPI00115148E9|nr:hypothetical protein PpBr36_00048 [Pyricularia pennisetigena]TLS29192.1 hypothetical protein PpBr36_00048 [Pyricularia pennisetigena]